MYIATRLLGVLLVLYADMCSVADECIYDGRLYGLHDNVKKDCNSWPVSRRFYLHCIKHHFVHHIPIAFAGRFEVSD